MPLSSMLGEPEPFAYDREHVVMLSDWTDEKSSQPAEKN
uniref:Multicopper oxidase n=1 Tax=Klebsiella pneumoniae TaxID=573 RepID=A0A8B0STU3_KLEPN|nr:Multicopper oxidase [Klebsiella pneumoniae]